jgi:hypothetical protein
MSNIISSCRVSLTGSKIIIASVSTSGIRRSSCLQELVHLRHQSKTFKMTRRRARHGATSNGISLAREDNHHCQRTSEDHQEAELTGSSSSQLQEEEASEEQAEAVGMLVDQDLASNAERLLTWPRTAPILTRTRGDNMAAAEAAEVAVMIFLLEEAAEIKR